MRHIKKYNESKSEITIEEIINDPDIEWISNKDRFIRELNAQKKHDGKDYKNNILLVEKLSNTLGCSRYRNYVFIFKHDDCLAAVDSSGDYGGRFKSVNLFKDIVMIVGSDSLVSFDTSDLTHKKYNF